MDLAGECENFRKPEENLPASSFDPLLPAHTHLIFHQVAGHVHGKSRNKLGILKHENGDILKPLFEEDERSLRELQFYENIFSSCNSDPISSEFCTFLAKFKGTWIGHLNDWDIKYLRLQDVASIFKRPCILDVKIGSQTYDPLASDQKIKNEKEKFPYGYVIGFRILGMKVYMESEKAYYSLDRPFGKQLTPETVVEGLNHFFNGKNDYFAMTVLAAFIHRLKALEDLFSRQRRFEFYSSSLLFLYEGDQSNWESWLQILRKSVTYGSQTMFTSSRTADFLSSSAECESETLQNISPLKTGNHKSKKNFCDIFVASNYCECCPVCSLNQVVCKKIISDFQLYDVRMIDFAHVFQSDKEDSNYLFGLRKLISSFQVLQKKLLNA